jgi:hypothetical protein
MIIKFNFNEINKGSLENVILIIMGYYCMLCQLL